jgi:Ala-tRNA(Pro) deacylase
MAGPSQRLLRYLDEHGVEYAVLHHPRDFRASSTAVDTQTPPEEFAKTVFLKVDGAYALAVVPASRSVALRRLRRALGAREVELASEEEVARLCPDCEVGAAPPFGGLYGLPVYVSAALSRDERITFNAGSHTDAIRMGYRDFEKLVQPRVLQIAKSD